MGPTKAVGADGTPWPCGHSRWRLAAEVPLLAVAAGERIGLSITVMLTTVAVYLGS